jgi:hypothetical protein
MPAQRLGSAFMSRSVRKDSRAFAALLVAALVAVPLPGFCADVGPLAAGNAAGVKQAQNEGPPSQTLWLAGAGVAVALGVLLAINNKGNAISSVTITTPGNTSGQVGGGGTIGSVSSGAGGTTSSGQSGDLQSGGFQSGGFQSGGAGFQASSGFIGVTVDTSATTTTTTTTTTATSTH